MITTTTDCSCGHPVQEHRFGWDATVSWFATTPAQPTMYVACPSCYYTDETGEHLDQGVHKFD